jgi:hypothetical protein
MKRSLAVLIVLLIFSCTCFSYNSLVYKKVLEAVNTDIEANRTDFALGYPLPSNAPTAQSNFALGYPLPSNAPTAQSNFALGYPPPINNPTAQSNFALGYPLPCNMGIASTVQRVIIGFFAYTTYVTNSSRQSNAIPNVKRVAYRYDGSKFTLGVPLAIAAMPRADGITFLPDGNLVVGGESNEVYLMGPQPGPVKVATIVDARSDHVTYDSQRNVIWTSGDNPFSDLVEVPLNAFGSGLVVRHLKGDDAEITQIGFDPSHNAYYTSSLRYGYGSFGVINLDTFTTTRKISNLPAAHGIAFDHFTNTFIVVGATHITQIDPKTFAIVSDWAPSPQQPSSLLIDQVAVDGHGHLLAASNDGNLIFIDYTRTRKVADTTNYQYIQFLEKKLDDVTLLCQS